MRELRRNNQQTCN